MNSGPIAGRVPDLPPGGICLADDHKLAHPGELTDNDVPCPACVPVEDFARVHKFLMQQPNCVDDPSVPAQLGVTEEVYSKIVRYFRAMQAQ